MQYDDIILYHTMQARITITIPEELVQAADARARSLDRSRSWVLVEALRQYMQAEPRSGGVREPAVAYAPSAAEAPHSVAPVDVAAEVAASRTRRLQAELALAPLERLRRADELGRLGRTTRPTGASAQLVGFDQYDDYYEWKRTRLIRV